MVNIANANWKRRLRRYALRLAIAAFLCAGVYGGFRVYKKWEPRHLTAQAQALFDKGEYREAALMARRVLQLSGYDFAANKLMADAVDKLGLPDTVMYRERVAKLRPGSLDEGLAWAEAALRFYKYQIAETALASVADAGKNSARFHSLSGSAAIGLGKMMDAEADFSDALRLDPQNALNQYNLASLHLQSGDEAVRASARETLKHLSNSPQTRGFALRALINEAFGRGDIAAALEFSTQLQAAPDATLRDRTTFLDLLKRSNSADLPVQLKKIQALATESSTNVAIVIAWMNSNALTSDSIAWAQTLDAKLLASPEAKFALALCYVTAKDWDNLHKLAGSGNWTRLEYDRRAFLARALREEGQPDAAEVQCESAIGLAAKQPASARQLLEMISAWNWFDDAEKLLWAVTKGDREQGWALELLYRHYASAHDSRGLCNVATRLLELDPTNDRAKNDVAMFSMLLNSDLTRAFKLAAELYAKDSTNTTFISTYAYALHLQGRSGEALALMNTLTLDKLEEPSNAAYYGIFLLANGAPDVAQKFFEHVKGGSLFPEETKLVQAAQREIR